MKKVSIVGFGRFGRTLYRLLKDDFDIVIHNRSPIDPTTIELSPHTKITHDLAEVYASEVIFFAVPISGFEQVVLSHSRYFEDHHLLIDVLSVKLHPAHVFETHLKGSETQALLTHPMFGPDSSRGGFTGLPMIMDRFMADEESLLFWKQYFTDKKLKVIEMSADEHDKLAAHSQGLTHFIGRLLQEYKMEKTAIDSLGAKKLIEIKEQTCNDSWQLFVDLQQYNPYTKEMRLKLGDAYDQLYNKLLPEQVSPGQVTIGIQGGKGSFNEEAALYFLNRSGVTDYSIKYLYTSENVLSALHQGMIDRGQFAIHNSLGGVVGESIEVMARYKFRIVDQYAIKIAHALMIRRDVTFADIDTIMSHPQVFAQCKQSLAEKYPHLKQISGEGELVDHSLVSKGLSEGTIDKTVAVMGSKVLAELYDLKIIEDNLQDAKENYTSFLQVARL